MDRPAPVITWNRSSGRPASRSRFTPSRAVNGVCESGLSTTPLPALLAGNGVVLKPDSQTPFTALLGVNLLREAGLPEDLFQVITGAGRSIGTPMIDRVDYLMFTGSTATGRHIATQC